MAWCCVEKFRSPAATVCRMLLKSKTKHIRDFSFLSEVLFFVYSQVYLCDLVLLDLPEPLTCRMQVVKHHFSLLLI